MPKELSESEKIAQEIRDCETMIEGHTTVIARRTKEKEDAEKRLAELRKKAPKQPAK